MNVANRIAIYFFTALFFLAAIVAVYFQQWIVLGIPFLLLICTYLIQSPTLVFYLLLAAIPWSIEFNFNPSLGTDLPDEPLMLLSSLAVLLLLIYNQKKFSFNKIHPLIFILLVQLAWTIFTIVHSTYILISIKYFLAKSWYLLAFVVAPILLFREEKILKRSAIVLLCSMLLLMVVTLVRHGTNGFTFKGINQSLEPFFINHVNYSALLVFMVPIEIAVIQLSSSKKVKRLLNFILIITIIALYFSYSRGAWLALIIGLPTYWLIRKKALLLSFILFFFFCIAFVFWMKSNDRYLKFSNDYKTTIFHTNFREHLIATYELKDVSNAERLYRWVAGVRMVKDRWRTGFGPNSFYNNYKSYALPAFETWVSDNKEHSTVHNYFLLMLIEQGVLGLLLFLGLLGSMFWYVQKIYHRSQEKFWKVTVAAVGVIVMMECIINFLSDMVETDKAGSIFYLCLAVIVIADYKTKSEPM